MQIPSCLSTVSVFILLLFACPFTNSSVIKESSTTETILIKVGGSSITNKAQHESLNEEMLDKLAQIIARNINVRFRNDDTGNNNDTCSGPAMILIHGAGSFGHYAAKKYGLQGKTHPPPPPSSPLSSSSLTKDDPPHLLTSLRHMQYSMQGLAETRLSVQSLNQHVVRTLLRHGVHATSVSPCFGLPLQAHGGDAPAIRALISMMDATLEAGLLPVLHGDACLYGATGAGILSGDTLMELLGVYSSRVSRVIFLTDVDGVYTSDPNINPQAQLLSKLTVNANGVLESVAGTTTDCEINASGSLHDHDVTGGLQTKLQAAANIAASGKNVTIANCASPNAEQLFGSHNVFETNNVTATLIYLAR